jgi:hypothetical protein
MTTALTQCMILTGSGWRRRPIGGGRTVAAEFVFTCLIGRTSLRLKQLLGRESSRCTARLTLSTPSGIATTPRPNLVLGGGQRRIGGCTSEHKAQDDHLSPIWTLTFRTPFHETEAQQRAMTPIPYMSRGPLVQSNQTRRHQGTWRAERQLPRGPRPAPGRHSKSTPARTPRDRRTGSGYPVCHTNCSMEALSKEEHTAVRAECRTAGTRSSCPT